MAFNLSRINQVSKSLLTRELNVNTVPVRNGSKKSGTSKVKKSSNPRPARFGVKVQENERVRQSNVLIHQRYLFACPGLNVGVGRIADLYAKVSGRLVLSYDKTDLKTDNYLVFTKYPGALPKYKCYFNVIPDEQHRRFKLIDSV